MSQNTETAELREKLQCWGQGSDTLNLPSASRQIEPKQHETNNMKELIEEFKGLYEERLRRLELQPAESQEEILQMKVSVLQTYVNDLADQNQVLVQTIENLEREANQKVSNFRMKLCTSDGIVDIQVVRTLSLDDIAGPVAHIPNVYALEGSEELLVSLLNELSCLQQIQNNNVKELAERDISIGKLHTHIQLLQQEGADTHVQVSRLNERVKELQEEVRKKEAERRKREEEWKREYDGERKAHAQAIKKWAERAAILNSEVKEREERVKHLDQDVVALRVTQDSLKRTLAMKEKHTEQLVQDNSRLKDSLAALQSKLQTSECMVSDISETLDQVKTHQSQERQQIQEQLHHANQEVQRLQQELTHVRRAAEKKIQRREVKVCVLLKELTESKKQHSDCQRELRGRESVVERLRGERDELRAKMEEQSRECVSLNQTKDKLETELALCRETHRAAHLEVRSRDQLILQLRAEMKTAEQKHQGTQEELSSLEAKVRLLNQRVKGHQEEACQLREKVRDRGGLRDQKEKERLQLHEQLCVSQQQMDLLRQRLKGAQEDLKEASVQAQDQKETVTIFKQKYIAAMEKVHRVQGQVESLEEELRYSQQQLRESQVATCSVKAELAELEGQYRQKVGQWESSQEALDQLTDELQANQNLLQESRQKVGQSEGLVATLQEQVDALTQQKLILESDLKRYQKTHSQSDEEYLSLLRHRQQLQKRCTEQVERLVECEKAVLQMKTELERQSQEKAGLERNLVTSHHTHLSNRSRLVQEVTQLKQEVTRLELQLADAHKVHNALLRQSEEDLKEARQEAARRSREVKVQKEQGQRLQEELQKTEEEVRSGLRENQSLRSRIKQLSQELEELHSKHQWTVEELAARAEEAKRMAGCLNEGKLAEEKIRSVVERLEKEVTELEKALQQAVDQRLKAEREKQDAQGQVDALRLELEGMRSDNENLRHESQLVMSNVSRWITEQKTSNESLAAQIKAQNKVLVIITEEKEHLQEANDTLKEEVKTLKEVAERKREMECFKAQIQDQGTQQEERMKEQESCVALNLSKIEDMQTRLRSNLEAIGMLNQQLSALGGENERLRRQLEEERSVRRQVERLFPPPPTHPHCSSAHLPLSCTPFAQPPLDPLSPDRAMRDMDRVLTQAELSRGGPERPGESPTLAETRWRSLAGELSVSVSLEDVWSGRKRRDLTK
ncbi:centrosome-associated protein CEP250-like [Myripristis murdjan]|uniref:centrosome-associated protein CEP250-like n=1 Tax=Myripristis murdjan TaxID=586833 RepID=UPI001175E17D|nr:centrosome-associated protein CEP250-like [Myripristis murdjan]